MHEQSTDEKYIQRWVPNGVFFVSDHGHDHVDLSGIVIGLQRESASLPDCSLKKSAQVYYDYFDQFFAFGRWICWIYVLTMI